MKILFFSGLILLLLGLGSCSESKFGSALEYQDSIVNKFTYNNLAFTEVERVLYDLNPKTLQSAIDQARKTCQKNYDYVKQMGGFEGNDDFRASAEKYFKNDLTRLGEYEKLIPLIQPDAQGKKPMSPDIINHVLQPIHAAQSADMLMLQEAQKKFGLANNIDVHGA